ncbi:MAG: DUF4175 family protein [Planctomycetaceae bacterium]
MTATITPSKNTKAAAPPRVAAIERIHLDLDEMVSRLRREIWIGGILLLGTTVMASLLAMLVIDALFQPESAWIRFALWLPLLGSTGAVTRRFLVLPLQQECDRLAMAWTLEQRRPTIEERLTTSLQLTEAQNVQTNSLIEAVAQQAQGSLAGCQGEDLRGQEVLSRTIVAVACFAAFVLSMWVWAPYLIPSLYNVLKPWSGRMLPQWNAIIAPGNTVVGEGNDVRITATARHVTEAVLEVIEHGVIVASHQMATEAESRTAEFTLMGVHHDLQYRVRSGGLYSDNYQIEVHPKPVMESIEVSLTFPEYTQLPPRFINDLSEPIEALQGTRICFDVDTAIPCAESSLSLNGTSIPCGEAAFFEETMLWRQRWELMATAGDLQRGTITLISETGVASDPIPFVVRVLPDLPPSIIIDQPALSEIITTSDRSLQITCHAVDDFGCSELHLITKKNGESPTIKRIPHDPGIEFTSELTFDSSELDLTTGDQLTVWLSITDNRPDEYGGPQTTDSRKIHVQIADEAAPISQQAVQHEARSVLADLTEALDNLKTAEQITSELQQDLGEVADKMAEWPQAAVDTAEKVKRLKDQVLAAEQSLRRLTEQNELAEQPFFQPEIERIQEVTDKEVAEAKKQVGLVPLSDNVPQKQVALTATKESLREAIDKLEKVRADIDERGQQLELAAQLDELALQQDRLARELQEGQNNAPEVQDKQQQIANALQELVDQDLDAQSEQFAKRAEQAAELSEVAAELQQQQEELAHLDQARSNEALNDQLLEMVAREQEQITQEARNLEEQARDNQPPAADAPTQGQEKTKKATEAEQTGKSEPLAEARKQMEAVPEKLRQKELEQAEAEARQASERLQKAAESNPGKAGAEPNAAEKDKAAAREDDLQRLAKQQERVRDAIKAVREDRPEVAVAKLQEQIAERTERLRDKADELLQLPTEDPENQQAVRDAREKLDQAQQDTKAAEQGTKAPVKPSKPERDPMKAGDPMQADDPIQAGDPMKPDGAKPANQQQEQAAKSLQEATQSLDSVCKSCKKCSNCNKPGGSSNTPGSSSKSGSTPSESKEPMESKPNPNGDSSREAKPGESGPPSRKGPQPESQKLAEAADKAHQTARTPSPEGTQQLAEDLNQLADKAAQQADYPNRKSNPNKDASKSQAKSDSSNQSGSQRAGNPSSQPQGVKGNAGAGQSEVAPTPLRGRSTSNWTQSRRKLKSNILDDQADKIPEEFRGVVKDYFEELSRLESRQDRTEAQK